MELEAGVFAAVDDEHRLLYLDCPPNLDLPKAIESRYGPKPACTRTKARRWTSLACLELFAISLGLDDVSLGIPFEIALLRSHRHLNRFARSSFLQLPEIDLQVTAR